MTKELEDWVHEAWAAPARQLDSMVGRVWKEFSQRASNEAAMMVFYTTQMAHEGKETKSTGWQYSYGTPEEMMAAIDHIERTIKESLQTKLDAARAVGATECWTNWGPTITWITNPKSPGPHTIKVGYRLGFATGTRVEIISN